MSTKRTRRAQHLRNYDSALVRAVGVTYDDHPRYEVTLNGAVIGHVEGNNPTFERSSKGRRYVNSRWRSKRRYWRVIGADGRTILHDVGTRKRAVEWLVSFCPNVKDEERGADREKQSNKD